MHRVAPSTLPLPELPNLNLKSDVFAVIGRKIVTHTYHARIYVTLRSSVLDPAGTAVQSGLSHMGYDNVQQVRIGKYIELTLTADSQPTAELQVDRMCDQLLANPVIENYCYELQELTAPAAAPTGA